MLLRGGDLSCLVLPGPNLGLVDLSGVGDLAVSERAAAYGAVGARFAQLLHGRLGHRDPPDQERSP